MLDFQADIVVSANLKSTSRSLLPYMLDAEGRMMVTSHESGSEVFEAMVLQKIYGPSCIDNGECHS